MNWSALTKKQQQMAIGTVVLAVIQIFILVHFLGGRDFSKSGGGGPKEELAELQGKLTDARQVIRRGSLVRDALDKSIADLEELSVHTPTRSDRYAWAYEYVSVRAAKAGVELTSLEEVEYLGDNEKDPTEQAYEISIATECGYGQLVEFLRRIEKENPLLRVKDVSISRLPDSLDSHKVSVALQWPADLKIEKGSE
jgi:hypothetical protein